MNRAFLLFLLAGAVALAGCQEAADPDGNGDDGGTVDDSPVTEAQARTLLSQASEGMPDRYGMTATVTQAGRNVMTLEGAFDNATGESYVTIQADTSFFQDAEDEESAQLAAFAQDLSFYVTKDSVVYIVNGTAFVFPADDEEDGASFVPDPEDSPVGEFLDPSSAFGELDENVTIQSVRPVTYKGKAAVEIVALVNDPEEDRQTNATITVYRSPARLAKIEADMPEDEEDAALSGAHLVMELAYDDDVELEVPEAASRAAGLAYENSQTSFGGFGGGENEPQVWTFQRAGGISADEIEVHIKDASQMGEMEDDSSLDAIARAPTLWSMKLSDGTKTEGGVTVTFDDADGDGKVSPGDTLTITGNDEGGLPPQAVLFDTVTETYVVPGLGVWALLAGVAVVALALRRR